MDVGAAGRVGGVEGSENGVARAVRNYRTGLIANGAELRDIPRAVRGSGWSARFARTSAARFLHGGKELIFTAPSWLGAQRALNLVRAGLIVVLGEPMPMPLDVGERLVAWNDREPAGVDRELFHLTRER